MLVVSSAIICTTVSHGAPSDPLVTSKVPSDSRTYLVMITLRVDGLWDHNRTITYSMLGGFVVTYGAVAAFFTVTTVDLHSACESITLARAANFGPPQKQSSSPHPSTRVWYHTRLA